MFGYFVILLGFLLIVLAQASVYRRMSFDRLTYHCSFSKTEVFEGEEFELIEVLENRKFLPLPWMKSQITVDRSLEISEEYSMVNDTVRTVTGYFSIPGKNRFERRWKVKATRRGDFLISNVTLVASDLFGRVTASKPMAMEVRVTVLPQPLYADSIPPAHSSSWGDTVVRAYFPEDPFYLSGVREYTGREPLSAIHWKATAKMQELMVYRKDCTANRSLLILLNMQSRSGERFLVQDKDTVEDAIRVCASLLDGTVEESIPVQLLSNGTVTPDKDFMKGKFKANKDAKDVRSVNSYGEAHVMQLMRMLSNLQYYTVETFDRWLLSQDATASEIAIISGYCSDGIVEYIRSKQQEANVRLYICGKGDAVVPEDIPYCLVREV